MRPELKMWSRDTGQKIAYKFWQLSINHNIYAQNQRCSCGNGATLLFFGVWIDGLPNFLMYGVLLSHF